jgi:hypothetical protein
MELGEERFQSTGEYFKEDGTTPATNGNKLPGVLLQQY